MFFHAVSPLLIFMFFTKQSSLTSFMFLTIVGRSLLLCFYTEAAHFLIYGCMHDGSLDLQRFIGKSRSLGIVRVLT